MASKISDNNSSEFSQSRPLRLTNFDLLKAVSYVLLFYCHSNLSIAIFNDDYRSAGVIAHFLISALIFSAGYFFTHSWKNNIIEFVKSKTIRLLIPFLFTLSLFLITSRIGQQPIEAYVWNTNLWFVVQLLIVLMLFVGLEKLKTEWQRTAVVLIVILFYVTQIANFDQRFVFNLIVFYAGYLTAKYELLHRIQNLRTIVFLLIVSMISCRIFYHALAYYTLMDYFSILYRTIVAVVFGVSTPLLLLTIFEKIQNKLILTVTNFIVYGGCFLYLLQPLWFTLTAWIFRGYYEVSPEWNFGNSLSEWFWFFPFYFLITLCGSWLIQKSYDWIIEKL